GYVHTVSIMQAASLWLFFTATAITGKGVQGEAYLIGYPLVITIAGILLGGRETLVFTILSLGSGLFMVFAQSQSSPGNQLSISLLTTWIISLVLFPVGAILQRLAANKTRFALTRARASEKRYRLISQVSSDYTFSTALDSDGNMHLDWVAGAFEEITGYTYDEYVANGGWFAHLHPDDVEQDAQDMAAIHQNQKVITEVRTFTKKKEVCWVRVYGHPVWDEKNDRLAGIVGAVQNITEHKELAKREASHQASLEKVLELGKYVTESNDLQTAYKRIWHAIRHDLGFDRLGIYLYDAGNNYMAGTYGTNNQGEMTNEADKVIQLDKHTPETNSFLKVLKDKDGYYFTHQYDIEHNVQENPIMLGVKDYVSVAAWTGSKPVAVLCVDNSISQQPITDEQLESLRLLAGFAGLAIENSRLKDALQHELIQQKAAEEKEASHRTTLEKVVAISKQVTEVINLKTTVERIWHVVHDDLGLDRVGIYFYNDENKSLDMALGTDDMGNIDRTTRISVPRKDWRSFKKVLETQDVYYFTQNYSLENNLPETHEMYGVKNHAMFAAWAKNKPVAIIVVDNNVTQRPITAQQLEALRLFTGYAGLAIENSRLNEALQSELEQRQIFIDELEVKNAELERFTYTVSHDLKSPLVTITGFLGYLEQDATTGNVERVKSGIDRISRAARKMQALLNDLLELSRIGRIMNAPEDVPFTEIVNEAIDHVRGQLDALDAIVESQTEYPVIHGDRIRLVEVVQNLIDNAVKYSSPKTKPRIEIGTNGANENGDAVFFVRDNGIGIDEEYHDRIFGLFNKLDAQSEGTGIGLSLVKRIIEVHNGRIWVTSEKGKGSTFHFTLPTSQIKE
ncbi:MAG TPA: ATP-binding protein, partial [Anaerolineales bacterium]|nr:ATP-binding protein [Anaerolineales bacterium]